MKSYPIFLLTSFILSTNLAASPNVTISGTIPGAIKLNAKASQVTVIKPITLQKINFSKAAKTYLANHVKSLNIKHAYTTTTLPSNVNLGMENVPVLNQGEWGSCVTFAITGSIDALLKKGDYISQLCNLELGAYLESIDEEHDSGWNGSDHETVLGQIQKYGVITMETQKTQGCGSERKIYEYPLHRHDDKGAPMTIADFSRFAEPMNHQVYWKSLLNFNNAFSKRAHEDNVVMNVKLALANGHRVVIEHVLDVNGELFQYLGAMGNYQTDHDTWVVTEQVKEDIRKLNDDNVPDEEKPLFGGHAMIITGFNDHAIAIEKTNDGQVEHKGIFTIRNSVTGLAGDRGTFYMSYDYFKLLNGGAIEISSTPFTVSHQSSNKNNFEKMKD